MRRTVPALLAVGVSLVAASPLAAFPIPPRTLWSLAEEADLIVVAKVISVSRPETPTGDFDSDLARLQVLETWKGRARATLDVPFTSAMICPAPPRYVPGETVLAFLTDGDAWVDTHLGDGDLIPEERTGFERFRGKWITVSLSYGSLYPDPTELPVFRQRTREAVALQARGRVPEEERVAWLVRAAASRATRWHGLYELMPESDAFHSAYDRRPDEPAATLTRAQLDQIAAGFVREPVVDGTLPMALTVLAGHEDAAVDRTSVSAVEAVLGSNDRLPYWTRDVLKLVIARFGDPGADRWLGPCEDLCFEPDPAAMRSGWQQARAALRIPKVAPLDRRAPAVRGVGGETPD